MMCRRCARHRELLVAEILRNLSAQWDALVINADSASLTEDAKRCATHLRYALLGVWQ